MWDTSFALPSMFIILIILAFYFSLPRLPIRKNRAFLRLILIETLVILSDIVSSHMDNNYESFDHFFLCFTNTIFFMAFFLRTLAFYEFTESTLKLGIKKKKLLYVLSRMPIILAVLLAMTSHLTHLIYYIDENGYHSGAYYNALYHCAFFYLGLSFAILFAFRKRLPRRRDRYALILLNLLVLAGVIVRLAFPRYLLMDTFCLIGIIVVYLSLENPDFYLELRGAVFNSRALREFVEENIDNLEYKCIGVTVRQYYEMRDIYGASQMDAALNLMGKYLANTCSDCMVFYTRKGRFVLLAPLDISVNKVCDEIYERFKKPWESTEAKVYVNVGFSSIDMANIHYPVDIIIATVARVIGNAGGLVGSGLYQASRDEFKQTERETEIKKCLVNALENEKVEIYLQPIVDSFTEEPVGAEALARIRDSEGNIIPPGEFIHIAENSGRINELGEIVFEKTCRFIKAWDIRKMGLKWINVNLSPVQFLSPDIADRYGSIVKKYGIDPELIHLEITEEAIIDTDFILRQTQRMVEKGFRFVLDDYGTGHSNLSRLRMFPLVNIKLDRGIVWAYCDDPDEVTANLVGSFVKIGIDVTAEGVEDENMAIMMKDIGCNYLQGFYYSKAIAVDEFVGKYGG